MFQKLEEKKMWAEIHFWSLELGLGFILISEIWKFQFCPQNI